jgi:hypothetical protein
VEADRRRRRTGEVGLRWRLGVVARGGNGGLRWLGGAARKGAGLFIAGLRSVRGGFFTHTGAPARSAPVSSSTFARRRPVTRLLGQRRQVNSCRWFGVCSRGGAGSTACSGGRGVVVLGGSDGSRRGAVLRRGTEVGSTVACGWG